MADQGDQTPNWDAALRAFNDPASADRIVAPGCIDVFVVGTDDAIWTRSLRGGTWWPWSSLGGKVTSDPAAISCAPGQVDVLARGADLALVGRRLKDGVWQPWRAAPGRVDVAALSADRSLWVGAIR